MRASWPRAARVLGKLAPLAPLARLLNAPLLGAIYLGALYASFVTEPLVPASQVLLGKDAKEISSYVAVRFADVIRHVGVSLGIAAVTIGLALGLLAMLLVHLRDRIQGLPRRGWTGARAGIEGLALVVLLHAFAFFASVARWPTMYAPELWSKGGYRASLQLFVTDRLGPRGVTVVAVALLALYLVGRPSRWREEATRGGLWLRSLRARPLALALAAAGAAVVAVGIQRCAAPSYAPIGEAPRSGARGNGTTAASAAHADGASRRSKRSVVVIATDGLRADRLRPDIAPHLSAFAERGTSFERAYVDVPRTLPSWLSILSGRHPHHHGVRTAFPRWDEIEPPPDTLPARLRAQGYTTIAVSDYAGDVFRRLDFGMTHAEVPPVAFPSFLRTMAVERATPLHPFLQTTLGRDVFPEVARWSATTDPRFVADDAIRAIRRHKDEPLFLLVFFSTTHFPYAAPSPWHRRFTRPDYTGPFRYDKTVTAGVPIFPDKDDVVQIRGLYDGAVAAVDDAAGSVLDEVRRSGLADDAVVVLTTDHGELLFEHDRWHGHGDHFFGDEATHVPLVIVDPREQRGRRERALVSSVDLAPTLYELLGVAAPKDLDGRSLVPALRGQGVPSRPAFAETELLLGQNPGLPPELHLPAPGLNHLLEIDTDHGHHIVMRPEGLAHTLLARHRMVRDDRWKLVYMPTPKGVVYRLFDTTRDPEEIVDLAAKEPAELARLRALLWAWMLEDPRMEKDGELLVPRARPASLELPPRVVVAPPPAVVAPPAAP